MNTNFKEKLAESKKYVPVWDEYWKKRFPNVVIDREIVLKLDQDGVDVILRLKNGLRYHVDEKVNTPQYGLDNFPIEVLKNVERKLPGWAATNNGNWVAMVHRGEQFREGFVDEPILFQITDKFKERILESKKYKTIMTSTQNLYHTLCFVVPKKDLLNVNNDSYWYSVQPKIWLY